MKINATSLATYACCTISSLHMILQSPVMIIDGVTTSITTQFSITYSYSASGSCTMIVPLSCDQQQWCNYTLTLDNCPTMTSGSGMFSVVPLNIIGSGTTRNSDLINKNSINVILKGP